MRHSLAAVSLGIALIVAQPVRAATDILFILDASNSMWGQVEGKPKIDVARQALAALLSDLPADTRVGLMAYGHRRAGDCSDVELLAPVGALEPKALVKRVEEITPQGKTPLAASLEAAKAAFGPGMKEDNRNVILISDGVETCGGEPCKAAADLAAAGIGTRIHVVGFDLSAEEKAALDCIAREGHGKYVTADTVADLSSAVQKVVAVARKEVAPPAVKAEPAQATSNPEPAWVEEFDGEDLGSDWEVIGRDDDRMITEDGQLVMIADGNNYWGNDKQTNLVIRKDRMPKGDWDAIIDVAGELQTGRDQFQFGLYTDSQNFLRVSLWTKEDAYYSSNAVLQIDRMRKGEFTKFTVNAYSSPKYGKPGIAQLKAEVYPVVAKGIRLILSKRGRKYFATLEMKTGETGAVRRWTTEKLTSIRVPGRLAFNPTVWDDVEGESIWYVERVMVVPVAR